MTAAVKRWREATEGRVCPCCGQAVVLTVDQLDELYAELFESGNRQVERNRRWRARNRERYNAYMRAYRKGR